ncbi:hypothetical protein ACN47E_008795 [Coniothyrium glycines]
MIKTIVWFLGALFVQRAFAVNTQVFDTTSGPVEGTVKEATPNVAQYLGIPFAEPPVGARRWLPAVKKVRKNMTIDATELGLACPQFQADKTVAPNLFLMDVPEFTISPKKYQSEDCLTLAIWSPLKSSQIRYNKTELLPVIVWLYGGAFVEGGGTVPYQDPSTWVERSGRHIVVGLNYRVNIFGFPNAAGLKQDEQNLGLLDQRLGLEWVRDNIANFGGDRDRITLWGQSAGAISVDNYNFAHADDPIVSGLIMNSGTSQLLLVNPDIDHTNFSTVADHFGCIDSDGVAELDCMRGIDAASITSFLKQRTDEGGPSLAFYPVVDNRTQLADYTSPAQAGAFSKVPAIIGTTTDEGVAFMPYDRINGVNVTEAAASTNAFFLCPAVKTTQERYAANATTFRHLYGGNFSNVAPLWWQGAYHSSDLPLIFGTYGIARGKGSEFQGRVSQMMQDFWVAFAEDPVKGLPKLGWASYQRNGTSVVFGMGERAVQTVKQTELDAPCAVSDHLPLR